MPLNLANDSDSDLDDFEVSFEQGNGPSVTSDVTSRTYAQVAASQPGSMRTIQAGGSEMEMGNKSRFGNSKLSMSDFAANASGGGELNPSHHLRGKAVGISGPGRKNAKGGDYVSKLGLHDDTDEDAEDGMESDMLDSEFEGTNFGYSTGSASNGQSRLTTSALTPSTSMMTGSGSGKTPGSSSTFGMSGSGQSYLIGGMRSPPLQPKKQLQPSQQVMRSGNGNGQRLGLGGGLGDIGGWGSGSDREDGGIGVSGQGAVSNSVNLRGQGRANSPSMNPSEPWMLADKAQIGKPHGGADQRLHGYGMGMGMGTGAGGWDADAADEDEDTDEDSDSDADPSAEYSEPFKQPLAANTKLTSAIRSRMGARNSGGVGATVKTREPVSKEGNGAVGRFSGVQLGDKATGSSKQKHSSQPLRSVARSQGLSSQAYSSTQGGADMMAGGGGNVNAPVESDSELSDFPTSLPLSSAAKIGKPPLPSSAKSSVPTSALKTASLSSKPPVTTGFGLLGLKDPSELLVDADETSPKDENTGVAAQSTVSKNDDAGPNRFFPSRFGSVLQDASSLISTTQPAKQDATDTALPTATSPRMYGLSSSADFGGPSPLRSIPSPSEFRYPAKDSAGLQANKQNIKLQVDAAPRTSSSNDPIEERTGSGGGDEMYVVSDAERYAGESYDFDDSGDSPIKAANRASPAHMQPDANIASKAVPGQVASTVPPKVTIPSPGQRSTSSILDSVATNDVMNSYGSVESTTPSNLLAQKGAVTSQNDQSDDLRISQAAVDHSLAHIQVRKADGSTAHPGQQSASQQSTAAGAMSAEAYQQAFQQQALEEAKAAAIAEKVNQKRQRVDKLASRRRTLEALLGATISVSQLQHVSLEGVGIRRLPHAFCKAAAGHLQVLNISHNNLQTLPRAARKFVKLEVLNASNNPLLAVPTECWCLPCLNTVRIADTRVVCLPSASNISKNLKTLVATGCSLYTVPASLRKKLGTRLSVDKAGGSLQSCISVEETVTCGSFTTPPRSHVPSPIGHLLLSPAWSDLQVLCGGKARPAHRWVFTCRCPALASRVDSPPARLKSIVSSPFLIHFEDLQPENVDLLLWFLYNDSLPEFSAGGTLPFPLGPAPSVRALYDLEAASKTWGLPRLAALLREKSKSSAGKFISVMNTAFGSDGSGADNVPAPTLERDIMAVFERGVLADGRITCLTDGTSIPAHASILYLGHLAFCPDSVSGPPPKDWELCLGDGGVLDVSSKAMFDWVKRIYQAVATVSGNACSGNQEQQKAAHDEVEGADEQLNISMLLEHLHLACLLGEAADPQHCDRLVSSILVLMRSQAGIRQFAKRPDLLVSIVDLGPKLCLSRSQGLELRRAALAACESIVSTVLQSEYFMEQAPIDTRRSIIEHLILRGLMPAHPVEKLEPSDLSGLVRELGST